MDTWLHWIIVAFAWIWVKIHDVVVALGLGFGGGAGWIISIVILTLLVRAAIIPLYLKQIKSQRGMQAIQPEIQKLQAKYKGKTDQASRQRQSEELMALYKKNGTSPYSSCLPLLVQMPVLFALYRVIFAVQQLNAGTYVYDNLGPLTKEVAAEIANSKFLGIGLFESLNSTPGALKIVFVVLIGLMVLFQFLTMRMSMTKNMPPAQDPNNPMVRSQKTMMYMMPAMFIFMGFIFQMALLIYMITTTIFSWVQQVWVIKALPTPGSPAYDELIAKREKKYQQWGQPYFEGYDRELEQLTQSAGTDSEAASDLAVKTLAEAKKRAKGEKVDVDFPEEWSTEEQLSVLRGLAFDDWKALPDETWLRELKKTKASAADAKTRKQPKKLSREQRIRRAQLEAADADAQAKYEERQARKEQQKAAKAGTTLTPEEVERRRQERRAAERKQRKQGKKKK
ncbi:membrane protein insertase YidC [Actinomyces sp. F1_1611]